MSGGRWDYVGSRIRTGLEEIAQSEEVKERWPRLAEALDRLGQVLYMVEHDMDWDLSADSYIDDDPAFEKAALGKLLDATLRALPDDLFERGKWATIQAWQERTGSERYFKEPS